MSLNEPGSPRPRRAGPAGQWYLVAVLTAIYMLKFVDSAVVNVVVNPIKADLGISDVQMSVLLGLAFVSLYALLSVPAGYVVDTVSRRLLLAVSVLFWSLMAALTGFAGNYWQFFACRVGLGMGEAALQPAALSLMKDGVSPDRRGRAFSVYQAGLTLGGGAGALVGGALFSLGAAGGLSSWPILGHMKPWQLVIALPGLFGILVSPLLLTIHEPRRTHSEGITRAGGFGEAFSYIGRHWRLYLPIFGGETAVSMAAGGAWNAWLVAAIGRTWGLSPAPIAQTIGSMQLLLFPAAAFLLGWVMDLCRRRGRTESPLWVGVVSCLLNVAPSMLILLAPNLTTVWVAYGLSTFFCTAGAQISSRIMLANVTPSHLIGKIGALYYLTANLLGQAFGVSCIALVAQYGFSGPRALPHAMICCYLIAMAATIVSMIWAARSVRLWAASGGPEQVHPHTGRGPKAAATA